MRLKESTSIYLLPDVTQLKGSNQPLNWFVEVAQASGRVRGFTDMKIMLKVKEDLSRSSTELNIQNIQAETVNNLHENHVNSSSSIQPQHLREFHDLGQDICSGAFADGHLNQHPSLPEPRYSRGSLKAG